MTQKGNFLKLFPTTDLFSFKGANAPDNFLNDYEFISNERGNLSLGNLYKFY